MEVKERTTSDQIARNMREQGRTNIWLINQLGISKRTFYIRMNENTWKVGDIIKMKQLGVL